MLFISFFYLLKSFKIPVSITEWLMLMESLSLGLNNSSLTSFYYLARAILVKSENYYDQYDRAFFYFFEKVKMPIDIREEILNWLEKPIDSNSFSKRDSNVLKKISLEKLKKELEERIKEQKERHDGGSHWIGTGGTSPFGHGGVHSGGIRIGGSGNKSYAAKIAERRSFKNYRTDLTLEVRQIKVALKKLRKFSREGPESELSLKKTIEKTCSNAGEIELVFERKSKNNVKVLLLMDSGGSMNSFSNMVSCLFSAASQVSYFKDLKNYYFHNCIYHELYKDIRKVQMIPLASLFKKLTLDYKVIFVGDAFMAPSELFDEGGVIDYYQYNEKPGIESFKMISKHFPSCVWLNPMPKATWHHFTIKAISDIFPMYPLTVDGIDDAVRELMLKS